MDAVNWHGHRIAAPDDAQRLDADLGHRIGLGLPHDMAKQGAYSDYRRGLHDEAAAYHLKSGQHLAEQGQREAADRHRQLYKLHVARNGHREPGVPKAVQARLQSLGARQPRFFESHRGDAMLME